MRFADVEADEATNRYQIDSLRAIRTTLQQLGLWTPRENRQGGTGDCAVAAISSLAEENRALRAELTSAEVQRVDDVADAEEEQAARIAALEAEVERVTEDFNSEAERVVFLENEVERLKGLLESAKDFSTGE